MVADPVAGVSHQSIPVLVLSLVPPVLLFLLER